MDLVVVEDEVELAYVGETPVERFDKDLQVPSCVKKLPRGKGL